MHLYLELFKAKDAWLELTVEQRAEFAQQVGSSAQEVVDAGAELVGVGAIDPETSNVAGYDFYAVWSLPSPDVVRMFEKGIEDDGWYTYFEQVNASGELMEFSALIQQVIQL